MSVLIVAATFGEIEPFYKKISDLDYKGESHFSVNFHQDPLDFLITGVGMVATSVKLATQLHSQHYDLVLNAGIAGSLTKDYVLAQVVLVESEIFGDLGVEHGDGSFSDLFDLGLTQKNESPFTQGILKCNYPDLKKFELPRVAGLTVNRVHGSAYSIRKIIRKFRTDIESMEGAAVFYTCLLLGVPFMEIRAISNFVEKRDRNAWRVEEAIINLNKTIEVVLQINSSKPT